MQSCFSTLDPKKVPFSPTTLDHRGSQSLVEETGTQSCAEGSFRYAVCAELPLYSRKLAFCGDQDRKKHSSTRPRVYNFFPEQQKKKKKRQHLYFDSLFTGR